LVGGHTYDTADSVFFVADDQGNSYDAAGTAQAIMKDDSADVKAVVDSYHYPAS